MSTSATLCMERLESTATTEELDFAEFIARTGLEPVPGGQHAGGPGPLVIEDLGRADALVLSCTGGCASSPIESAENTGW